MLADSGHAQHYAPWDSCTKWNSYKGALGKCWYVFGYFPPITENEDLKGVLSSLTTEFYWKHTILYNSIKAHKRKLNVS